MFRIVDEEVVKYKHNKELYLLKEKVDTGYAIELTDRRHAFGTRLLAPTEELADQAFQLILKKLRQFRKIDAVSKLAGKIFKGRTINQVIFILEASSKKDYAQIAALYTAKKFTGGAKLSRKEKGITIIDAMVDGKKCGSWKGHRFQGDFKFEVS